MLKVRMIAIGKINASGIPTENKNINRNRKMNRNRKIKGQWYIKGNENRDCFMDLSR